MVAFRTFQTEMQTPNDFCKSSAKVFNDHDYFVGLAFVNGTVNRLKKRYNERTRDFLTLIC